MTEKRYVPDSWTPHELPALIAIAEWDESTSNEVLSLEELTERMGRPAEAIARVAKAISRIEQAGYINAKENRSFGDEYPDFMILGLTPLGLEAVGAWPRSSDDLLDVFLRVLESKAQELDGTDSESASKIRNFARYVGTTGIDVGKSILTAWITHQIGA